MRTPVLFAAALCAAWLALAVPGARGEEAFSFYGLEFGMTREAATQVFKLLPGDVVRGPGYGIASLSLGFDPLGRLMEIRAEYPRPEGALENEALKRALREKFVLPAQAGRSSLNVTVDEFGNRAGLTLVILSKALREENIERLKRDYLRVIDPGPPGKRP